jgi:predicted RNA-binding Zn-ribbon protein involved in translation (DUF1610 family)
MSRGYEHLVRTNAPYHSSITETAMERLHFICPNTGRDIDVGIDSELDTLLRIRSKHVLACCPVCGEHHEWEVREARLLQAA